jgi:uncharacterized protein
MKFHLAESTNQNAFTGYGDGYVMVNRVRFERSLVVAPDRLVEDWPVPTLEALTPERVEFLAGLGAEVVLLGTGPRLTFPDPRLLAPLSAARVGIEVMDTNAACRTYNILMSEGRKVVAALIL